MLDIVKEVGTSDLHRWAQLYPTGVWSTSLPVNHVYTLSLIKMTISPVVQLSGIYVYNRPPVPLSGGVPLTG